MKNRKPKIFILVIFALFLFFFSGDFGLIDVEKTSIITAVAIDRDQTDYVVTAQIAVPEATDTNTENQKAQISGKGSTVGGALKDLSDISGWFPKLQFCNLILLGQDFESIDVIRVLDYFAKTLRVQDSALVGFCQGKAKDILSLATPLDNISSFALQKIMFKNPSYDREICSTDIKTFCVGYYSRSSSSVMPIIRPVSASGKGQEKEVSSNQSQTGSSSSKSNNDNLFDARTTALFKKGIKVGELNNDQMIVYNALTSPFVGGSIAVDDVATEHGQTNYLLNVLSNNSKVKVTADEKELKVQLILDLYCKVSDTDSISSSEALSQNNPLPESVRLKINSTLFDYASSMIDLMRQSQCDFLNIKEKLYRFNYKWYSRYENSYLDDMNVNISVNVYGQK